MTLIKKDAEVLGFSIKDFNDDEPQIKHYHKDCWKKLKKEGYPGTIEGVITKETLQKEYVDEGGNAMKVLCNECGEEIRVIVSTMN